MIRAGCKVSVKDGFRPLAGDQRTWWKKTIYVELTGTQGWHMESNTGSQPNSPCFSGHLGKDVI